MKQVDKIPPDGRLLSRGPKHKYDYDRLLDGSIYCLKRGEDFDGKPNNLSGCLRRTIASLGREAKVCVRGDCVYVQATDTETPGGGDADKR